MLKYIQERLIWKNFSTGHLQIGVYCDRLRNYFPRGFVTIEYCRECPSFIEEIRNENPYLFNAPLGVIKCDCSQLDYTYQKDIINHYIENALKEGKKILMPYWIPRIDVGLADFLLHQDKRVQRKCIVNCSHCNTNVIEVNDEKDIPVIFKCPLCLKEFKIQESNIKIFYKYVY